MISYFMVFPETALNCLIGKPANCIWEESITGYRATIWHVIDGTSYPESEKVFASHSEAEKWARKRMRTQ